MIIVGVDAGPVELANLGAGVEGVGAHRDRHAGHDARLRDDVGQGLSGQIDDRAVHLGALGQVAREGDHVAARTRNPRFGADRRVPAALGQQQQPQAGSRAERRGELLGVGVRQLPDRRNAKVGKLFGGLRPDAPQCVDWPLAHDVHPVRIGEGVDAVGFAEAGGDLGALLVVADAHRTGQPGLGGDLGADRLGQCHRVGHPGTDVGLVPAPDLYGMTEIAQHSHHLIGGLVVGGRVRGQERRVRAAARRAAQRHPGVHAELARLVGGARHHLARLGRIAAAADDHRQADEFGVAAQLDGGQELIEVHVQDPVARLGRAHFPHSLRATLSQASPSVSRVRPRSTSWRVT